MMESKNQYTYNRKFESVCTKIVDDGDCDILFGCEVGAFGWGLAAANIPLQDILRKPFGDRVCYDEVENYVTAWNFGGPCHTNVTKREDSRIFSVPGTRDIRATISRFDVKKDKHDTVHVIAGNMHIVCAKNPPKKPTRRKAVKALAEHLDSLAPDSDMAVVRIICGDNNLVAEEVRQALQPVTNSETAWTVVATPADKNGDNVAVRGGVAHFVPIAIGFSFPDRGIRPDSHDALAVQITPHGASPPVESDEHERVIGGPENAEIQNTAPISQSRQMHSDSDRRRPLSDPRRPPELFEHVEDTETDHIEKSSDCRPVAEPVFAANDDTVIVEAGHEIRPAPDPVLAANDDTVNFEARDEIQNATMEDHVRGLAQDLHEKTRRPWNLSHDPVLAANDDTVNVEAGDEIQNVTIEDHVRGRAQDLHEEMRRLWNLSHDNEWDPKTLEHLTRVLFLKRKSAPPAEEGVGTAFESQEETVRAIAYVLQIRFDYLKEKQITNLDYCLQPWERREFVKYAREAYENTQLQKTLQANDRGFAEDKGKSMPKGKKSKDNKGFTGACQSVTGKGTKGTAIARGAPQPAMGRGKGLGSINDYVRHRQRSRWHRHLQRICGTKQIWEVLSFTGRFDVATLEKALHKDKDEATTPAPPTDEAAVQHRIRLHHAKAEAIARYKEGERLARFRAAVHDRNKPLSLTYEQTKLLRKYDDDELRIERNRAVMALGHGQLRNKHGDTMDIGGSTGGVTRRILDNYCPPDAHGFLEGDAM